MKIAHVSDLHFGCARPEVVEALLKSISKINPDLVAISGDLTQRARASQFKEARAFLSRLHVPWLCVPGNHDLPLFNLFSRFFTPFRGYKKLIHPRLNVGWIGRGTAIFGFNTTGRIRWQLGRIRSKDYARTKKFFASVPEAMHKVLVVHHPNLPFSEVDVDLVLCGHLHLSSARVASVRGRKRNMIVVAAGTAVSARERGESNSFNEIELHDEYLCLHVHTWDGSAFQRGPSKEYLYHLPSAESSPVSSSIIGATPSPV